MLSFFKKKQPENVELTYEQRLRKLESKVTMLESETLEIMQSINIIRNKVLKKIQFKNPQEPEEQNEWGGIPIQ